MTRCAWRVGRKQCKRQTPHYYQPSGNWWHCWQHEQPGQWIDIWFGSHPRDLKVVHWWIQQDGLPMRLCDGDNTEDAPPPTHDCDNDAEVCKACQDIYLMDTGGGRFRSYYLNEFGDTSTD